MSGRILITRPLIDAQNDAEIFERAGYETWIEPLLIIQKTNQNIERPPQHSALIFTSANAVRLFKTNDKTTPVYTVGPNTKKAAIESGYKTIQSADGNAKNLLQLIKQTGDKNTSLLFPRGEHTAFPLAQKLREDGYHVIEHISYTATPASEFSQELITHIQQDSVQAVTIYSKRTAENFITLIKQHNLLAQLQNIKLLSISPAVVEYVHSQIDRKDWPDTYSAEQANAESMLRLVNSVLKQQKTENNK